MRRMRFVVAVVLAVLACVALVPANAAAAARSASGACPSANAAGLPAVVVVVGSFAAKAGAKKAGKWLVKKLAKKKAKAKAKVRYVRDTKRFQLALLVSKANAQKIAEFIAKWGPKIIAIFTTNDRRDRPSLRAVCRA
jgi:hypothetical protein